MLATKDFKTYGIAKKDVQERKPAPIPLLVALLLVPTVIFAAAFYLMSFSLRYHSAAVSSLICYCMVLPAFAFLGMSLGASGKERTLSLIIGSCCFLAWVAGYVWGDYNYQTLMRPYYDITQLNTYQRIDPNTMSGSQFMDAGMLQFVGGSRYETKYSMSFKNGDTYCVAPIAKENATGQVSVDSFDFWAVGINCCSGHAVNFQCGLYSQSSAWGLRVMEDSHRNMYEVAIKQAEASFSISASHPILVYMVADPMQEVHEWSDDGTKNFVFGIFAYFAFQIAAVVGAAVMITLM